jgi:superfamily II DNA or RNA helicase
MKLSVLLASDFLDQARMRGSDYYRRGAVQLVGGSAHHALALVSGSRIYDVDIAIGPDDLTMGCDCPYFADHGGCKHVWATILAAEDRGWLTANARWRSTYDYEPVLPKTKPKKEQSRWRQDLEALVPKSSTETWPADREILYVVDVPGSVTAGVLVLNLFAREPKRTGGYKKATVPRLTRGLLRELPNAADRHVIGLLSATKNYSWSSLGDYEAVSANYSVLHPLARTVMELAAATGRCMLRLEPGSEEFVPIAWDGGEPWRVELRLSREDGTCVASGFLRRGQDEMELSAPVLVTDGGLVFTRTHVAPLAEGGDFRWISYLRAKDRIEAPAAEAQAMLAALIEHPSPVKLDVPEDMRFEEIREPPKPMVTVHAAKDWRDRLRARLSFEYAGHSVADGTAGRGFYDANSRRFVVRDPDAEAAARQVLTEVGLSGPAKYWDELEPVWDLPARKLPALVSACLAAGWHVEADGKLFRRPGAMRAEVSSGVDWFELHGEVDYGETSVKLPALLAAMKRGDGMVKLDDGTYGVLPEEWLTRFGMFARLGTAGGDHIRFRRNQAGLLDALLAAQPEFQCDDTFARVRNELRTFDGVRAAEQPGGFVGQLRDYQREGLGWMHFLRRFGFGGCLADDMGVGKTAQVLALLEARRTDNSQRGPSLVVVPKSLVFNWKQESERFTPSLRVLDHTGGGRNIGSFNDYDLILTTYGTLRRDAAEFSSLEFDYVVLDEAQTIKNAETESAKAARLLKARHRLALSGTPVENHLGELWSLFEFLNPGMLGSASVFKVTAAATRNPSEETKKLLAHALRPFLLRRTKEQVAKELPAKSEQTIFCEMEGPQRKLYNELRTHYRNSLLKKVDSVGLAKSKIQVLEALLRLRQAACHPGLLDPKRIGDPSAKIDLLMEQLEELIEEGHKALVFSQFTSLLAIVRDLLDKRQVPYEYLDGATRDRQQCVEKFQNDPDCRLFLISLKAGGLGLNLTAAEYVFLLDPWWNPAVEAQAVDRAHRIGQTRQVFAYRIIARDTVEEKVLELQKSKRELAAAIIGEENSVIRDLKREDLELLLS